MGRRPKPDSEKRAAGYPGKRKAKTKKPAADAASIASAPVKSQILDPLAPPADLDGIAAEKWRHFMPHLIDVGLLSATDLETLRLLCLALADSAALRKIISRKGFTERIQSNHGRRTAARKEVGILQRVEGMVLNYMQALAMTPTSRVRALAAQLRSNQLSLPLAGQHPAAPSEQGEQPSSPTETENADPIGFAATTRH